MTAASVAALTIYDMVKGMERGVEIAPSAAAGEERWPPRLAAGRSVRAAVITVSTSRARGDDAPDESGPRLEAVIGRLGGELAGSDLIADDAEAIAARLRHWADEDGCDLILTSGGTGLAPSDVTPEASSR